MAIEIERKWLVDELPEASLLGDGVALRQGYLAREGKVEARVRLSAETAVLTVKGGAGLTRVEVEAALTQTEGEALWPLTAGRRIEKVRHCIELGESVAELDVYQGELEGLLLVEVEFGSAEEAAAFVAPPWFGRELTGEPKWTNASLADHGAPQ